MESLYTKYRPATFADVVDQSHVVATLERAVLEQRVGHAYLFCGPRGTGKTTMARILAKALLCTEGLGKLPDGTCEECHLIAAGEHPDVLEIDAASNTGVDNVRDAIIGRVNYAPVRGNYKVYIVDEVHMLTTAAFNALLKTLEEPPSNVTFILCTTDPQKVPATILSRVQRFDFHAVGNDGMRAHLERVCVAEDFSFEPEALDLIVRHAHGGMRDALTELEQVSVNEKITLAHVRDLHGEVSSAALSQIVGALARRDVPTLFEQTAGLVNEGRDLLQFVRELAGRIRDLYVLAALGTTEGVVNATEEELIQLKAEADSFEGADRLARVLSVLGDTSDKMRTAPNQRLELEIAFTKLARPNSDITLESLAERIEVLEQGRSGAPIAPPALAEPEPVKPQVVAPAFVAGEQAPAQAGTSKQNFSHQQVSAPVVAVPTQEQTSTVAPAAPAKQPTEDAVTDPARLQRKWRNILNAFIAQDPAKGSLLQLSTLQADEGERLIVALPKGSSFSIRMLERDDVRSALQPIVVAEFGPRKVVYVESGESAPAPEPAPEPEPEPEPTPTPQAGPQPAPTVQSISTPAPVVQPQMQPQPQPQPEPMVQSMPVLQVEAQPAQAPEPNPTTATPAPVVQPAADPNGFENNTLENIASMLTDYFGPATSVIEGESVQTISTNDFSSAQPDEFDGASFEGNEFIDEPIDDFDDTDY